MTCRYVSRDSPRVLPGRHGDECPEVTWHPPMVWPDCIGCVPCSARHCGTCGRRHVEELTCPDCIGQAREDITTIAALNAKLLTEAVHRGIESEAAMLDGAVANVAAWRQRRTYGYRDHTERDRAGNQIWPDRLGEKAPLWVLGTWDLLVTEHYGHHRTQKVTVTTAAGYLRANLTELAQDPDFVFDDMARDVRECRAHLEAVLHDQARGDIANVDCFDCGGGLERKLLKDGFDDHWTCRICKRRYTYAEYNFALRARLEAEQSERIEA